MSFLQVINPFGLLFAALGVYWLVVLTGKEVSGPKIVELK